MKLLFETFIKALDEYAEDARSLVKWATQEQAIKGIKLDFANHLKKTITEKYLSKDTVVLTDCEGLCSEIQSVQGKIERKREGRKIEPGYFDALLVWMLARLHAAIKQLNLPVNDPACVTLSHTQLVLKNLFDAYSVLIGGFYDFPDSRNALEVYARHHSRTTVYAMKEGWNAKVLPEGSEQLVIEKLERLKQTTIRLLRNLSSDQEKVILYYMTLSELHHINPVLQGLEERLAKHFDLKPITRIESSENELKECQESAEIGKSSESVEQAPVAIEKKPDMLFSQGVQSFAEATKPVIEATATAVNQGGKSALFLHRKKRCSNEVVR